MIWVLSPSLPLSLPLYLFGFSERESIVLRTTKAPLQTFASISRSRDSSNRIVSVFGRKSSPSFATLRVVSSMAYEKELDAAKKAASLAARLCQKVQKALLQSDKNMLEILLARTEPLSELELALKNRLIEKFLLQTT